MTQSPISNPKAAAELGEKIYREQYKSAFEIEHAGKFVAINVLTGDPYIADTPESALDTAYATAPSGVFHLIQVGHAGAFRVSYTQSSNVDWIFR
ncbi:hypothetical protein [Granulicella paludicola]|uniref:hypothetical protein n=1 Tax=Granulicella paludicola TaxID=474951 RepID=UPI0021E0DBBD|nr:hypothetical protein [Granulicella paludicola]